jgi:vancomycin aglycone glucosyltransferase
MNATLRRAVHRHREALGLARLRDIMTFTYGRSPLLAADPLLGPAPADTDLAIEALGCLHPFAPEPLPAKLEAFLQAGEPPVYVGFGSMTDPAPEATTRIVLDAIAMTGCRAVLCEGWAGLGVGALPEDVCVVGSVSHAALFPRVAAVAHHGGAGTTTTAARAGVPQIVIPHVLDQFYWAKRVQTLGLGPPPLRRSRLDVASLTALLREVVGNELLAERTAEVGARMRRELAARSEPGTTLTTRVSVSSGALAQGATPRGDESRQGA